MTRTQTNTTTTTTTTNLPYLYRVLSDSLSLSMTPLACVPVVGLDFGTVTDLLQTSSCCARRTTTEPPNYVCQRYQRLHCTSRPCTRPDLHPSSTHRISSKTCSIRPTSKYFLIVLISAAVCITLLKELPRVLSLPSLESFFFPDKMMYYKQKLHKHHLHHPATYVSFYYLKKKPIIPRTCSRGTDIRTVVFSLRQIGNSLELSF